MNQQARSDLAVDVEHLSRTFRGTPAVQDVSLQIPVGSIFGLVGLNGAGKTTLIRHLIGSLKAQHGRVTVLGDDPVRNPEGVLKRIGYLTEEDSLPKWMRVGELIDFTRAIYPSWDDSYAKRLCEMFELARATRLQSLSKGQRARAGLLVAIAHRPELLLLDEPSGGLDPIARSDILEAIIRTISEDGRTVLFSSHLLDEVDRVCDTVALMHEGRIIESLTTEQLETRYGEIVLHPTETWKLAPVMGGATGWRKTGQEWSAVVETKVFDGQPLPEGCSMIERRDITLERWFEARVGARVGARADASDDQHAGEVPADV
jgi:ABC-2 type transport system ATP-binding protein